MSTTIVEPGQTRPRALSVKVTGIPAELRALKQWVNWSYEQTASGSWTKEPYDHRSRKHASSIDPATWTSFTEVFAAYEAGSYDGVGFVFSADDRYCGIDLDDSRDPDTGEIAPWAREIVGRLASYTEVSASGRGIHVIVKGALPPKGRKKGAIEMYDRGRFFALTGCVIEVPR